MKRFLVLFGIMLLASLASGYVLHLVTPVNVYLEPLKPTLVSPVGPGYKVILAFDRDTPEDFVWDNLQCINGTWNITYAKDHKYLYAFLYVPRDAEEGNYTFSFTVADRNGDHVQEDAIVVIHVTRNPWDLAEIKPLEDVELYAGNNTIPLAIDNKALGEARYKITYWVEGVSRTYEKEVVISPGKEEKISLPINFPNEGYYRVHAVVESLDTPIIKASLEREYYVKPTLHSKFASISHGFPVIPVPLVPVYTILGLLSLI